MSVKVMQEVWKHSRSKGSDLLVMLALADYANDDSESWPSLAKLASKARLGERQLCVILQALEDAGEIRRRRSHGGRNQRTHYFITLKPRNSELENSVVGNSVVENTVLQRQETLLHSSDALNRHRTVNKKESVKIYTPEEADHKKRRELDLMAKAAEADAKMAQDKPASKSVPDPRVKDCIDYYHDSFKSKFGLPPNISNGKDGATFKRLLETYKLDKLKNMLDEFFKTDDKFVQEAGYTIGIFSGWINKYLSTGKNAPPQKRKFVGQ